MPAYTQLKGITEWGNDELSRQLAVNLETWLDWGLLGVGAFNNVTIPTSGNYGGSYDSLRLVSDPNYTNGQVWEGARQDWVWESGIEYPYQPIRVSGVYVNGSFKSISSTGTYSHSINYPLGRVVFNSPIAVTSTVKANYSYKLVNVCDASTPWFKEIMPFSLRVDDLQYTQLASGAWAVLSQNRVQLPAVVVEVVPRTKLRGLQLGGGQWLQKDIIFHVFSETPWEKNKLIDTIVYQKEQTLLSFDLNALRAGNAFPLDGNGSPVSGGLMYPNLVEPTGGFFWKKMFVKEVVPQEVTERPPLYQGLVRTTLEIDFPELA